MKDADGNDFISGRIYRDFGAAVLDFNSAHSNLYYIKELKPGIFVAKDAKGRHQRVWSREETRERYGPLEVPLDRVRPWELYLCSNQDVSFFKNNLLKTQDRVPKLISLLNNVLQKKTDNEEEKPFFLEVFVMNDPTSGNPVPIVRPAKKQSQPKCTVEETTFPFPHEDPNSPGYNPFKRGGDNPNPHIRY